MKEQTTEIVSVPSDDKGTVEIVPLGTDERIKLSIAIVKKLIAQPTRTGKLPDDNQCMKFIMLCKSRHLNPFEGDAYLLGYDTQTGPQFSLITAHQVFLKRAEASKGFEGIQSGVIVQTPEGISENEGDIVMKGETLIGGWAKVYRKDRTYPFYKRLDFNKFTTGRSRWEKDGPGMIVKCAEADALRTAFPTHLGGLYVAEEMAPIDIIGRELPIQRPKIQLNDKLPVDTQPESQRNSVATEATAGEAPKSDVISADKPPESAADSGGGQPVKKKTLRKKTASPSEPQVGPNESQMIMRLAGMERTKDQLVQVARTFDALKEDEGWSDIGEEGFGQLCHADNWPLIETELKNL